MTTFGDLVQQAKSLLRSFTGIQEQVTWLTSSCTDSDLTLSVNSSDVVSIGVSEIEEELVFVHVSANNTLSIAPFGRGYNGSTAAAHVANTPVVFDPVFPVVDVKRALNQVLQATYPFLYQIKTTTFTFTGTQATYELPADCKKVLRVNYEAIGPSNAWPAVPRWEFDPRFNKGTGKAITLASAPLAGRTVQVVYQAGFPALKSNADTLASIGFPESAVDVLLYGATAQLVRYVDLSRLQTSHVENISRSELVGTNDAGRIANQLYAIYQVRLEEERKKLLADDEPQMHFTR